MGIFDKVKSMLSTGKLDVSARFKLDRQAFSGTMSNFRRAIEIGTGRIVGIKFLDNEKSDYFEARFKGLNKPSEGEIGMLIKHPHIVETYEYGLTTKGQQYIIMEYIEGLGLNTIVQTEDAGLEGKRLNLIREMAESLHAVHEAGFIHRDICPRNFICAEDLSTLKLIDFGLTVPDKTEFRQPGNRTGTPLYMAPEIVRRRNTDKRVDIFALGVTAYRLCTFQHPWGLADTTGKAALAHDTVAPEEILKFRPDLNPVLAKAIMSCLSADPANRPESAEHFLNRIRNAESESE